MLKLAITFILSHNCNEASPNVLIIFHSNYFIKQWRPGNLSLTHCAPNTYLRQMCRVVIAAHMGFHLLFWFCCKGFSWGRRHRKLLDDLKERRGYSHLKEEALDHTMWRAHFGRGCRPVIRQTTEWMVFIDIFIEHSLKLCLIDEFVLKDGGGRYITIPRFSGKILCVVKRVTLLLTESLVL